MHHILDALTAIETAKTASIATRTQATRLRCDLKAAWESPHTSQAKFTPLRRKAQLFIDTCKESTNA